MAVKPAVLLASAAFVGALGYGGISLASAQTPTTTPNTTNPGESTTAPNNSYAPNDSATPKDTKNCPNMGSEGSGGTSGSSDTGYMPVPNDVSENV